MRLKYLYRLACKFESAPSLELEMPNLQAAIQEGWKAAGKPCVTSVKVLKAVEGTRAFLPHCQIK